MKIILIMGLPGSGKTTLENELARNRAQDKLAQAEIASLPLRVRN